MMNTIKPIMMLVVITLITACGQNFSDKEKELLKESTQEVIDDATKASSTPAPRVKTASYTLPFCDLLPVNAIKSVFPKATSFDFNEDKSGTPDCQISFDTGIKKTYMNLPAGIILKGFVPRKSETARTFLERYMSTEPAREKIDNLGDEAYLFPSDHVSFVVVIKDNLCYSLRLNYSNDDGKEKAIALMKIVIRNS